MTCHTTKMSFEKEDLIKLVIISGALLAFYLFSGFKIQAALGSSNLCYSPCPALTPVAIYKKYNPGSFEYHYYPSIGLNISVPSDWNLSQIAQSINEISTFRSPMQSQSDIFQENLMIKAGRYINNLSQAEFVSVTLKDLEVLDHFQLMDRIDNATIDGIHANKIAYSYIQNRNYYTAQQVVMIVGPSYLTFTYNSQLGKYAEYLPTIEKILSSIKINKVLLGQVTHNSASLSFKDNINGISVNYPSNWTTASDHYLSSIFAIYAPLNGSADYYYDNIRINIENLSQPNIMNLTAKEYLTVLQDYFKSSLKNFKLLQGQNLTISGNPSYSIIYSFTGTDKIEYELQRLASIKDNKIYTIIYDSVESSFDDYVPVLKYLLSSFKFIS